MAKSTETAAETVKIRNKGTRAYVIGEQHAIPGADPIEIEKSLTEHFEIAAAIEAGDLVIVADPVATEETAAPQA